MKRNWDLIRQILLLADGRAMGEAVSEIEAQGFDSDEVAKHFEMLGTQEGEARLIRFSECFVCLQNAHWVEDPLQAVMTLKLTWKGAEFLALIAEDGLWSSIKRACRRDIGAQEPTQTLIEYLSPRIKERHLKAVHSQWHHPLGRHWVGDMRSELGFLRYGAGNDNCGGGGSNDSGDSND